MLYLIHLLLLRLFICTTFKIDFVGLKSGFISVGLDLAHTLTFPRTVNLYKLVHLHWQNDIGTA